MQKIAATQFKTHCLSVMEQVSQSGQPVVVTRHGKAVVKVIPIDSDVENIFGALAGMARITGDLENTAPASEWGME